MYEIRSLLSCGGPNTERAYELTRLGFYCEIVRTDEERRDRVVAVFRTHEEADDFLSAIKLYEQL